MASININKFSCVDIAGNTIIPTGVFQNKLDTAALVIGQTLASNDPSCNGIISGIVWYDYTTADLIILTIIQP